MKIKTLTYANPAGENRSVTLEINSARGALLIAVENAETAAREFQDLLLRHRLHQVPSGSIVTQAARMLLHAAQNFERPLPIPKSEKNNNRAARRIRPL